MEDLVTEGLQTSQAIALDLGSGKMYWTDYGTDKIQRANLNGSDVEDLVTSGLKEPYGLTLGAGLSAQVLKVEGDSATLDLAGRFRDPEGSALTLTATSSDEAVATGDSGRHRDAARGPGRERFSPASLQCLDNCASFEG